eukprot:6946721-Ditylum_brightwellii.AAC.1
MVILMGSLSSVFFAVLDADVMEVRGRLRWLNNLSIDKKRLDLKYHLLLNVTVKRSAQSHEFNPKLTLWDWL